MSVIKLRNVANTNFIFPEIGPVDDRGIVRGKKVGCTPGNNILVTNEEEIERSGLLQQLISNKKLVPIQQQQGQGVSVPLKTSNKEEKPIIREDFESDEIDRLIQQVPNSYEEEPAIRPEDSVNLIAGDEDDAKELQAYLNSEARAEAARARDVVTQQPLSRPAEDLRAPAEKNMPDPKGANGTDLFYEQPARDILVDDPRPPSNLYTDYSEKKNKFI